MLLNPAFNAIGDYLPVFSMIIFKQKNDLISTLDKLVKQGMSIGLVPTMGALHAGHISLIDHSKEACNITVVSIFVNPTQFNDKKDFEKYPVTIEEDIYLLEQSGTDILFLPSVESMYPEGLQPTTVYNLGSLETLLEGHYRPGHFQGVCRIVHKLLNAVRPHHLYMGQKDYQQCLVIQKLINDFNIPSSLHIVPTQREASGLAMSSRNMRLSPAATEKAAAIYQAHIYVKANLLNIPIPQLLSHAQAILINAGFEKIDYIAICHAVSLVPVLHFHAHTKVIILTAAYIESVRLIDNLQLN